MQLWERKASVRNKSTKPAAQNGLYKLTDVLICCLLSYFIRLSRVRRFDTGKITFPNFEKNKLAAWSPGFHPRNHISAWYWGLTLELKKRVQHCLFLYWSLTTVKLLLVSEFHPRPSWSWTLQPVDEFMNLRVVYGELSSIRCKKNKHFRPRILHCMMTWQFQSAEEFSHSCTRSVLPVHFFSVQ